jgi:hypothetical protein
MIEWIITHPIQSFLILFVEYAVIMTLYHKTNKTGAKIAKVLAVPFVIQDALVNWFALTIVFLELPREALVTGRLQRWKTLVDRNRLEEIRWRFAWFMCDKLNKFDVGHC